LSRDLLMALLERPRPEYAIHFEPQVPMEARGVMHVNDEQAASSGSGFGTSPPGSGV